MPLQRQVFEINAFAIAGGIAAVIGGIRHLRAESEGT
jgi:hypothetical protein